MMQMHLTKYSSFAHSTHQLRSITLLPFQPPLKFLPYPTCCLGPDSNDEVHCINFASSKLPVVQTRHAHACSREPSHIIIQNELISISKMYDNRRHSAYIPQLSTRCAASPGFTMTCHRNLLIQWTRVDDWPLQILRSGVCCRCKLISRIVKLAEIILYSSHC